MLVVVEPMGRSECDTCGREHHAAHGRYQQCPECDRRYCLDCMKGGDVVAFGRCPRCPGDPTLRLEGADRTVTPRP